MCIESSYRVHVLADRPPLFLHGMLCFVTPIIIQKLGESPSVECQSGNRRFFRDRTPFSRLVQEVNYHTTPNPFDFVEPLV